MLCLSYFLQTSSQLSSLKYRFLLAGVGGQVDAKACIAALPDCEPRVLEHCLRTYSVSADDGKNDANSNGVSSEVRKARRRASFLAHLTLHSSWCAGHQRADGVPN